MTFFSILLSLLIEQLRPLRAENPLYGGVSYLAHRMEAWFNAGKESQGKAAWVAMMVVLMLPTALIYWMCAKISPIAALAWNVLIVYLTLGFRHYSHYFTSIQLALNSGDEITARTLLTEWTAQDATSMDANEIARVAVEQALITTHRTVFGVFFWFLMPVGPACAVMYRVAEYLARSWSQSAHLKNESFGRFAAQAFYWIDWIPVRLTAVAFAVVGNFEDAIYAWRNFADRWKDEAVGILLSSGGGAMGVRLGTSSESALEVLPVDASMVDSQSVEVDAFPGELPTIRTLQSAVGLVWRALLLWMLLLLLLSLAVWLS
jgi:adenosylcobinamide-phosphate synthase